MLPGFVAHWWSSKHVGIMLVETSDAKFAGGCCRGESGFGCRQLCSSALVCQWVETKLQQLLHCRSGPIKQGLSQWGMAQYGLLLQNCRKRQEKTERARKRQKKTEKDKKRQKQTERVLLETNMIPHDSIKSDLEDQRSKWSKWFPHISTKLVKSCRNPFSNPFFHVVAPRDPRPSLRGAPQRRRLSGSSQVVAGRVPRPRSWTAGWCSCRSSPGLPLSYKKWHRNI